VISIFPALVTSLPSCSAPGGSCYIVTHRARPLQAVRQGIPTFGPLRLGSCYTFVSICFNLTPVYPYELSRPDCAFTNLLRNALFTPLSYMEPLHRTTVFRHTYLEDFAQDRSFDVGKNVHYVLHVVVSPSRPYFTYSRSLPFFLTAIGERQSPAPSISIWKNRLQTLVGQHNSLLQVGTPTVFDFPIPNANDALVCRPSILRPISSTCSYVLNCLLPMDSTKPHVYVFCWPHND